MIINFHLLFRNGTIQIEKMGTHISVEDDLFGYLTMSAKQEDYGQNQVRFVLILHEFIIMRFSGGIFGTPVGLDPDFRSQRTRTLGLTRDPPESRFKIVNTDNFDLITVGIS